MTADRPGTRAGRPAVPHRSVTLTWTLLVPALLTAVGSLVVLSWRDQLPARVASHWGPGGVDGYSAVLPLVLGGAGATLALCGVMALVGTLSGQAAITRRFACGTAVWLAAFLQVVLVTTIAPQRGLTDVSDVPAADGWTGLGVVGATAAALLVAWLVPGDAARPATGRPPADAPRITLAEREHAAWVRRTGPRYPAAFVVLAVAPALVVGVVGGLWWLAAVLVVLLGATVGSMLVWTVTVSTAGLTVRSALGVPTLRVPLDEVEHAEVETVHPLGDFGGWGVRTALDGRTGVVVRAGEALRVHRSGGRDLVVTVDDAATGAALLNTLVTRRAAGAPSADA